MRGLLRLSSLLFALASILWWAASGARMGWWLTQIGVERIDEVTGLRVLDWQEGFVPGLETPALGLLLGGALFATTIRLHRKQPTTTTST